MRMTHEEIEKYDIVERYAMHKLSEADRRAFQEHYFACDECFEKAQLTTRFIAGVRGSSHAGVLAATLSPGVVSPFRLGGWLKPAFVLAAAASVVLAALFGWLVFWQLPNLRGEVERERLARLELEREKQESETAARQSLEQAHNELTKEREQAAREKTEREKAQAQLEELARNQSRTAPGSNDSSQVNAPLVILESERGSQRDNQLALPTRANSATLWIDVESGDRFDAYRLQLFAADGRSIKSISGIKRNSYGAVAVNIPAGVLQTGNYVVKLYGLRNRNAELLGEYDLRVRRQ